MEENKGQEKQSELTLVEKASDMLKEAGLDFSNERVAELLTKSPNIKEMFEKSLDLSNQSGQNVFDIIKQVIAIYEAELKRDDLTSEERERIYDRIDKQAENAKRQDDSNKQLIGGALGVLLVGTLGAAVKYGPKIIKNLKNNTFK